MHARVALIVVATLVAAACGGSADGGVVEIDGPTISPGRVSIRTLEPGATPTPTPSPSPTPTPGPTPTPIPPPRSVIITSEAGTQNGSPSSFCWAEQEGGRTTCYDHPPPSQEQALPVRQGEAVIVKIGAQIPPDDESIRPFQGSRSDYPSQAIDPALETELTIDLPEGEWSMDLCATWFSRGDSICWLFKLDVLQVDGN